MRFAFLPLTMMTFFLPHIVLAQECPSASAEGDWTESVPRAITGTLVYHDDLRGWFELALDRRQCDEDSIQLIPTEAIGDALQRLRGCRVVSTGAIAFSPTGYYSLRLYQPVERIATAETCIEQPPFPDYSKARPDRSIASYRVDMHVNTSPGDHPIEFRVTHRGRELQPWQAYANYYLTGLFVLYGSCAEGYVVGDVFGAPEAKPSHFSDPGTPSDSASFAPLIAAQAGVTILDLGYTCVRDGSASGDAKDDR